MKKYIVILAMMCVTSLSQGMQRTEAERLAIAQRVLQDNNGSSNAVGTRSLHIDAPIVQLATSLDFTDANIVDPEVEYYVYGYAADRPGFVIVASDDSKPAVIGFSANTVFSDEKNKVAMQTITRTLAETRATESDEIGQNVLRRLAATEPLSLSPMLGDIAFGQGAPYNYSAPAIYMGNCNVEGTYMPLGYVPACVAQIMKHYGSPEQMTGDPIDYYTDNYLIRRTWDCASTRFNWDKVLPNYGLEEYTGSKDVATDYKFEFDGLRMNNPNNLSEVSFPFSSNTDQPELYTFQFWITDNAGSLIMPASQEERIRIDPGVVWGITNRLIVSTELPDANYRVYACVKTTSYPSWHILQCLQGLGRKEYISLSKSGNKYKIEDQEFQCRNTYNSEQRYEIEKVTGAVAAGLRTDFYRNGNAAYGMTGLTNRLSEHFGFDTGIGYTYFRKTNYYYRTMALLNELSQNRPAIVMDVEWCAVVDGYKKENGIIYFHVNWGDDSYGNGYYAADAFMPAGDRIKSASGVICGIKPASDEGVGYPLMTNQSPISINKGIYQANEQMVIEYELNNDVTTLTGKLGMVAYAVGQDLKRYKLGTKDIDKKNQVIRGNDFVCVLPKEMPEGEYVVEVYSLYNGVERLIQNPAMITFAVVGDDALSLDKNEAFLPKVGETLQLNATSKLVDVKFEWKSSNPEVCTVSDKGLVTAVGEGTCDVTVTAVSPAGSFKQVCKVFVGLVLTLDKEMVLFEELGQSVQLTASCSVPSAELTWTSSDANVCKVSDTGLLTSVNDGQCEVSVTVVTPAGTKTAVCLVTVACPKPVDPNLKDSHPYLEYNITSATTVTIVKVNNMEITRFVIPDKVAYNGRYYIVTGLGPDCMNNCQFTSVTIPATVTELPHTAEGWSEHIGDMPNVQSYNVADNNPTFCSKDGVLYSKDMKSLIKYPARNTRTDYNVPETVEDICHQAFRSTNSLKQLRLPENVQRMSQFAFDNNRSIERMILMAPNVPVNVKHDFFYTVNHIILYVPESLVGAYKSSAPWYSFMDVRAYTEDIDSLVETIGDEQCLMIYSVNGHLIKADANQNYLHSLPNGVYLINGRKVSIAK